MEKSIKDILNDTVSFTDEEELIIRELENSDLSSLFDNGVEGAAEWLQCEYGCEYDTAINVVLYIMRRL